jgi:hypothetical protein
MYMYLENWQECEFEILRTANYDEFERSGEKIYDRSGEHTQMNAMFKRLN